MDVPPHVKGRVLEWLGWTVLGVVLAITLKISWFKWLDPIVDFGRELYVPWRLSEGAVLYRDVAAIYGPLSPYFNSVIFRLAGPGLTRLVLANLFIYAAILALAYYVVRAGWGRLAALLFFIIGFSFSHFLDIGIYNFAAPYSHETTHGFFLILVMIVLGASWLRHPTSGRALLMGLCCGLCALLKVEIVLAAGMVCLGVVARAWLTKSQSGRNSIFAFLIGGILPPLVATVALHQAGGFSWTEAVIRANGGWLGPLVYRDIANSVFQSHTLGTSRLAANFTLLLGWGIVSMALAGLVAWLSQRSHGWVQVGSTIGLAAAAALLALFLPWGEIGRIFPVWLGLAAFLTWRESPSFSSSNMRWLLLLAAAALLARMAFNPRIYHYGFYQAALAGMITVATAITVLPRALKLRPAARLSYRVILAAFLLVGFSKLHALSRYYFSLKRLPVGEGVDRFYSYASDSYFEITRVILASTPDCRTLLVVPEGVMLNYLLRKPGTISPYVFAPDWLRQWGKQINELPDRPPDYVVLVSRDLREYGVSRFGDAPGHGQNLLRWISHAYEPVDRIGADPLNTDRKGAIILRRSQ